MTVYSQNRTRTYSAATPPNTSTRNSRTDNGTGSVLPVEVVVYHRVKVVHVLVLVPQLQRRAAALRDLVEARIVSRSDSADEAVIRELGKSGIDVPFVSVNVCRNVRSDIPPVSIESLQNVEIGWADESQTVSLRIHPHIPSVNSVSHRYGRSNWNIPLLSTIGIFKSCHFSRCCQQEPTADPSLADGSIPENERTPLLEAAGPRGILSKPEPMDDDATGAHQSPDREGKSLVERTDCPECGRRLADHGLATAGPGRTRLAPCGLDVGGVTLREVARLLAAREETSERRVVADGGDPTEGMETGWDDETITGVYGDGGESA